MTMIMEFPLDEGGSLLVEIDSPESGVAPASPGSGVIERFGDTLEGTLDRIRPAATAILRCFRDLVDPPDMTEIEFGVKLTAEAGAVLAAAGTAVHYRVTLRWQKPTTQE